MAKIYTRSGDAGETGLIGGGRVPKTDPRVEAFGAIDELCASLGLVRAELARGGATPAGLNDLLAGLQHRLFDLGAELACQNTPDSKHGGGPSGSPILDAQVAELEAAIDRYEAGLEPLREFILPGGSPAAAALHVARCVCRRAERRVVQLASQQSVRGEVLRYVNRLGDLLFVLARAVNQAHGLPDVTWPGSTP